LAPCWASAGAACCATNWLEEPDLRAVVLSYTQAATRHGGAGALYVQLRKGGTR